MILNTLGSLLSFLDTSTALLFVTIALVTWWFYTNRNVPPGPWGLPIVGYLPFLDVSIPAEKQFLDLGKKYGSVMSLQLGSYLTVVLNDFESIKEAFVKQGDNFSARPHGTLMKIHDHDRGVMNTSGEIWRDQRRFALSILRDYGMGKLSLEPRLVEEIHFFLEEVAKHKGKPFDFNSLLGMSTANIISVMEFGNRFDYNDEKYARLRDLLEPFVSNFSSVGARAVFQWLRYVPFSGYFTGYNEMHEIQTNIRKFLKEIVDEHQRDYKESSRKDYIDAFLTERKATIEKTGSEGYFDITEELLATLQVLFVAGTETTTSTLRWAMLWLMIYPEMQDKIHKEIDDVIGMERVPTMGDRTEMKYTEAFLYEVQRYGSLLPLNIAHANMEETYVKGYRIPKWSVVMTNIWAVHFDPTLWKDPEKFIPERFYNDKGQVLKPEYLIPFGIGKRACLGESLARMELFMYFTSMLQRFDILLPEGTTPKLDIETNIVRRPKPYKILAVERKGYHVTY